MALAVQAVQAVQVTCLVTIPAVVEQVATQVLAVMAALVPQAQMVVVAVAVAVRLKAVAQAAELVLRVKVQAGQVALTTVALRDRMVQAVQVTQRLQPIFHLMRNMAADGVSINKALLILPPVEARCALFIPVTHALTQITRHKEKYGIIYSYC
jgi:hypothetical protein